MRYDEMINVLRDAMNGKTVERRGRGCTKWEVVECPSWDFSNFKYRTKPALKDFWINEYKHCFSQAHQSGAEANLAACPNRIRCIHVREVEE